MEGNKTLKEMAGSKRRGWKEEGGLDEEGRWQVKEEENGKNNDDDDDDGDDDDDDVDDDDDDDDEKEKEKEKEKEDHSCRLQLVYFTTEKPMC